MPMLYPVNDLGAAQLNDPVPDACSVHSSDIDLSLLDKTLSQPTSPLPPSLSPAPGADRFTFRSPFRMSTPVAGRPPAGPSAAARRPASSLSSEEDVKPIIISEPSVFPSVEIPAQN